MRELVISLNLIMIQCEANKTYFHLGCRIHSVRTDAKHLSTVQPPPEDILDVCLTALSCTTCINPFRGSCSCS